MLASGMSPCDILTRALNGVEVEFFDEETVSYRCNCSAARVRRALLTLGPDDIRNLAGDDDKAQVECHFCDKKYSLSKQELHELACVAESSKNQ